MFICFLSFLSCFCCAPRNYPPACPPPATCAAPLVIINGKCVVNPKNAEATLAFPTRVTIPIV